MDEHEFRELIWAKGGALYRDMPWRDQPTLYYVLVSELMLQQTQVSRVLVKFAEFTKAFPDVESLARADLADVLRSWQGLGYNRRAKFLHQAAQLIAAKPAAFAAGQQTELLERQLATLPGVGPGTRGALLNYVYEIPTAYVETNIRTVYFHHWYADRQDVTDRELLEIVDRTMDRTQPREWFWALMDYGTELKRTHGARLSQSKHYKKQSPLEGSVRQVRGQLIARLTAGSLRCDELENEYAADERLAPAVSGLIRDGLITRRAGRLYLTK